MTILDVWMSPRRAFVAVDTLGSMPMTLEPIECSKMLPLVHCNAVVAGAGNDLMLYRVFWELINQGRDFDSMLVLVPQIIDQAYEHFITESAALGIGPEDISPSQSIVIVGWSTSAGRVRGQYQGKTKDDARFGSPQPIELHCRSPDVERPVTIALDSAAKMEEHARGQVAWGRQNYPQWAIGGRLLVAYVDRDSMTITSRPLD